MGIDDTSHLELEHLELEKLKTELERIMKELRFLNLKRGSKRELQELKLKLKGGDKNVREYLNKQIAERFRVVDSIIEELGGDYEEVLRAKVENRIFLNGPIVNGETISFSIEAFANDFGDLIENPGFKIPEIMFVSPGKTIKKSDRQIKKEDLLGSNSISLNLNLSGENVPIAVKIGEIVYPMPKIEKKIIMEKEKQRSVKNKIREKRENFSSDEVFSKILDELSLLLGDSGAYFEIRDGEDGSYEKELTFSYVNSEGEVIELGIWYISLKLKSKNDYELNIEYWFGEEKKIVEKSIRPFEYGNVIRELIDVMIENRVKKYKEEIKEEFFETQKELLRNIVFYIETKYPNLGYDKEKVDRILNSDTFIKDEAINFIERGEGGGIEKEFILFLRKISSDMKDIYQGDSEVEVINLSNFQKVIDEKMGK